MTLDDPVRGSRLRQGQYAVDGRGSRPECCKTGITWNQLPAEVIGCSGLTWWRRLRDWTEAGVWPHQLPSTPESPSSPGSCW